MPKAKQTGNIFNDKPWGFKYVKLNTLFPNPDNPRTITQKAFERLQQKINAIGFFQPMILDNEGMVISGNQRYAALMDMGYGEVEVPVMYPEFKMTKRERDQAIITPNISDGEWNDDTLANLFDPNDLLEWGLDIPWKSDPAVNEDEPEKEFDISTAKAKIIFKYTDAKPIIDAFLKEMKAKYPELLYEVQIDD